jgi:hypothetical protein
LDEDCKVIDLNKLVRAVDQQPMRTMLAWVGRSAEKVVGMYGEWISERPHVVLCSLSQSPHVSLQLFVALERAQRSYKRDDMFAFRFDGHGAF